MNTCQFDIAVKHIDVFWKISLEQEFQFFFLFEKGHIGVRWGPDRNILIRNGKSFLEKLV